MALVEEGLSGDGGVVEVAITAHQIAGGVVPRRTAQGEGTVCTGLDVRLRGQRHLRRAVCRLPGAGGDRRAAIEAVITELAMQAGRFYCAQRARRPGIRQQIAVGVELGPPIPGTFEKFQIVAAVNARDWLQTEILRRLDRTEVLLLYALQHMVGTRRHLEARFELAIDEFAAAMVQVVIV